MSGYAAIYKSLKIFSGLTFQAEIEKNRQEAIQRQLAHEESLRAFELKQATEHRAEMARLERLLANSNAELRKMQEAGRQELVANYESQIGVLRQEITTLQNTPVRVIEHHHYHKKKKKFFGLF